MHRRQCWRNCVCCYCSGGGSVGVAFAFNAYDGSDDDFGGWNVFAVAGDVAVPVASLLAILRVGGECKTIVALVRWCDGVGRENSQC